MTAREWLQKAKAEKFAIGAFNVGNLETFKAIVQAAANKKSPVIIESSPGETEWMGADNLVDLAKNYSQDYGIPVLVNLDHAQTLEECQQGIDASYDLIHFDGSKLPLEQNLEIAKQVVEMAHQKGLTVEVEIDHITGSSEVHRESATQEAAKGHFSDPAKAKEFMEQSGADIFAAFFGNVHGLFLGGEENLHLDILEGIVKVLPNKFFSLHGGSGIPDDQVREAIKLGIVKVNINTEMRQAFKDTLEKVIGQDPNEYAMYKLEEPVVEAVQQVVEHKIDVFGSAGKI
ncbi:MAG: class II fructose-bisphosphate aldolase [Patescibacteria group bacterium]|nr:class II fructose-bisphosphate aldolase [Patescibacteria group bacterium]